MSQFWMPCSCGNQIRVSAASAGETVRCSCGQPLEVPTLRGLRELARVEPDAATARRTASVAWEDRHRVAFLLLLVALGTVAVVGYLALRLPAAQEYLSAEVFENKLREADVQQALSVYEELKKGLPAGSAEASTENTRRMMLWGMGIAGGLGLAALGGAGLVLARGRSRR
jgi:hypothetical protein